MDMNREEEITPDIVRRKIISAWIVTGILGFIMTFLIFSSPESRHDLTAGFATDFLTTFLQLSIVVLFIFVVAWSLYWGMPKVYKVLILGIIAGIAGFKILDYTPKHYIASTDGTYINIRDDHEENAKQNLPLALVLLIILAVLIIIPIIVAILYGATVGTYKFYKLQKIANWNKLYIAFTLIPIIYLIFSNAMISSSSQSISNYVLENKLRHPETILTPSDMVGIAGSGFKLADGSRLFAINYDCETYKYQGTISGCNDLEYTNVNTGYTKNDVRIVGGSIEYYADYSGSIHITYKKYDISDGIKEGIDRSIEAKIREWGGYKSGNINIGEHSGGAMRNNQYGYSAYLLFLDKNFYVETEVHLKNRDGGLNESKANEDKALNIAKDIAKVVDRRLLDDNKLDLYQILKEENIK